MIKPDDEAVECERCRGRGWLLYVGIDAVERVKVDECNKCYGTGYSSHPGKGLVERFMEWWDEGK